MHRNGVVILIVGEDDFLNSNLDDGFRTLVAGEQSDIDGAAVQGRAISGIQNGIEFGMADIEIFGRQAFAMSPRDAIVINPTGHAVIANGDYLVIWIDDAGSHCSGRIFGTQGAKFGDAHEIFVPGEVVGAV